jgi:hypothetical protein
MLLPYEERLKDDMSYFRKLGVKYEADALIACPCGARLAQRRA